MLEIDSRPGQNDPGHAANQTGNCTSKKQLRQMRQSLVMNRPLRGKLDNQRGRCSSDPVRTSLTGALPAENRPVSIRKADWPEFKRLQK